MNDPNLSPERIVFIGIINRGFGVLIFFLAFALALREYAKKNNFQIPVINAFKLGGIVLLLPILIGLLSTLVGVLFFKESSNPNWEVLLPSIGKGMLPNLFLMVAIIWAGRNWKIYQSGSKR